jgi:epoxide hydrolase-like predicted phosphatase
MFAGSVADDAMLGAVKSAREAGIKTGLISNSWGVDRYPQQLMDELFDGVVISGVVGIRKPAPEIYAMGAQAVGLTPDECVFVDDLGFNLRPAKELGMATVLHTDAGQTIVQLEALLGVALS